jgi:hypothetical protein
MTKPLLKSLPNNEEIYLVFNGSYTEADAKARFRSRFGYGADTVIRYNLQLWLGPVEPKSLMAGLA